jgi:hypothetical protein
LSSENVNCNVTSNSAGTERLVFKWKDEFKNQFNQLLIVNVDKLNHVVEIDGDTTQDSINDCVNNFTTELQHLMEPLFSVQTSYTCSTHTNTCRSNDQRGNINIKSNRYMEDKPWFDDRLKQLRLSYLSALADFNIMKNEATHTNLKNKKRRYKLLERKLKRQYKETEGNMLEYLKKYNPKQFYSKFSGKSKYKKHSLTLDQLYKHFNDLSGGSSSNNTDTSNIDDNPVFTDNTESTIYEELDNCITEQEVLDAIRNLKRGKTHGPDGILNECFIEGKQLLVPILTKMFNNILYSGYFPES